MEALEWEMKALEWESEICPKRVSLTPKEWVSLQKSGVERSAVGV